VIQSVPHRALPHLRGAVGGYSDFNISRGPSSEQKQESTLLPHTAAFVGYRAWAMPNSGGLGSRGAATLNRTCSSGPWGAGKTPYLDTLPCRCRQQWAVAVAFSGNAKKGASRSGQRQARRHPSQAHRRGRSKSLVYRLGKKRAPGSRHGTS
jgi:hypothetical protein